jgi:hypothetical protein
LEQVKYSFIQPRKKEIISPEVGLVLSFFVVIFLFIVGVIIYLSLKIDMFNEHQISFSHQIEKFEYQKSILERDIAIIDKSILTSKALYERNIFFHNSIKNILNLVPDKITLSKIEMDKKQLTIYGDTPSKDTYNLLMLAPLRSIFDQSFTSFFLQENGWYKFVSYNSMEENMTIFRNR